MEALNIKFVGEVEKHPELYNYTLTGYSKRDVTERAWSNVAKEINLSVNECKEKWRNLRTTFVKNLKPKPSVSGVKKKRPYYLMEAMQFAKPFIKVVCNPTGNLPETSQLPTMASTPVVDDVVDAEETEEVQDSEITLEQHRNVISPSVSSPETSQGEISGTPSTSRGPHGLPVRKRKQQVDMLEEAPTAYFNAKRAKLTDSTAPLDEKNKREEGIKNFLLSMVPDLMKLNDLQLRKYKQKSLFLIDKSDEGHSFSPLFQMPITKITGNRNVHKEIEDGKAERNNSFAEIVYERLEMPSSGIEIIAIGWGYEYAQMTPDQQLFAKKAIDDILFEGRLGNLNRYSVTINEGDDDEG